MTDRMSKISFLYHQGLSHLFYILIMFKDANLSFLEILWKKSLHYFSKYHASVKFEDTKIHVRNYYKQRYCTNTHIVFLFFQYQPIVTTWTSLEPTCHSQIPTSHALTILKNAGHVVPYRTNTIVALSITMHLEKNVSYPRMIAQHCRMDCIVTGTLSSVNAEAAILVLLGHRASRVS